MVERIEIARGLSIPIEGEPAPQVDAKETSRVALVGSDYLGMRPTMLVEVGQKVELGQPLFEDKKTPGVVYTSPAAGTVLEINRGDKRLLQSLIMARDGSSSRQFPSYESTRIASLERQQVVDLLTQSGLWTASPRPFSRIPAPQGEPPHAIFVNAMDSNPWQRPELVVGERNEEFLAGVQAVARLTSGKTYICRAPGSKIPGDSQSGIQVAEFDGPHPAGLVGTHMHLLSPVSAKRSNWYLNYQDAIAIGHLFLSGQLDPVRIISLAGPSVETALFADSSRSQPERADGRRTVRRRSPDCLRFSVVRPHFATAL